MVCLIKPQFETTKEKVGKKGVVRDPKVHKEVIESTVAFAIATGFEILGLDYSPIRGPEGNIEYLLFMKKNAEDADASGEAGAADTEEEAEEKNNVTELSDELKKAIDSVVAASHESLEKGE